MDWSSWGQCDIWGESPDAQKKKLLTSRRNDFYWGNWGQKLNYLENAPHPRYRHCPRPLFCVSCRPMPINYIILCFQDVRAGALNLVFFTH